MQVLQEEVATLQALEARVASLAAAASKPSAPTSGKAARRAATVAAEVQQQLLGSRLLLEGPRPPSQVCSNATVGLTIWLSHHGPFSKLDMSMTRGLYYSLLL